jgi:hypothetical protein
MLANQVHQPSAIAPDCGRDLKQVGRRRSTIHREWKVSGHSRRSLDLMLKSAEIRAQVPVIRTDEYRIPTTTQQSRQDETVIRLRTSDKIAVNEN